MSEQSELALAIRELRAEIGSLKETVGGLKETVGGLKETVGRNTAAIDKLTGRVASLDSRMEKQEQATTRLTATMERVNVRLASKIDAPELTSFVDSTNQRFERIERHLELA